MAAAGYILSARAAEKIRALASPRGASAGASHAQGGAAFANRTPPPFTVRWASEANNGNGAWIIYRPSIMFNGAEIDIQSSLTAAGDPYPEGWYRLDCGLPSNGEESLYLIIDTSSSTPTASFSISRSTSSSATTFTIASTWRNPITGEVVIRQHAVGAIAYGGGGSTAEVEPHPFEVRWVQELDSGQGAYMIWLPSPCVVYDGVEISTYDIIANQNSIETTSASPYDWPWILLYPYPPKTGSGTLYLNITADTSGTGETTYSAYISQTAGNNAVASVKIADVNRDETTGAVSITQYLVGSLVLGAGGGGAETTGLSGAYNIVTGVTWNSTFHTIVISGKTLVFENGLLTSEGDINSVSAPDGFKSIATAEHAVLTEY